MLSNLYAKLAAALVLGAGLAYAGYHVADLKGKAALASLREANALSLANAYKQREADHLAKETALAAENDQLKNDALAYPTVSVRMCKYSTAVVSTAGKGGQVIPPISGVGSPGPVKVPESSGPDYGPSLFGLADALDSITAKCRAI